MASSFVHIFILIVFGVVFRLFTGVDIARRTRQLIGSAVFNVLLPILAFHVLSTAPLDDSLITVPITAGLTIVTCLWIASALIPRLMLLPRPSLGALILASAWGNVTYLGLPVVMAVTGNQMQRIPIVYDLMATTPLLFTLGVVVCARYGTLPVELTFSGMFRQIITMPALIAVVLGLGVNLYGLPIPSIVQWGMQGLGSLVAPLMLFSVGMALGVPNGEHLRILAPTLVIKLVVSTIVGYGIGSILIDDPLVFKSVLLESAMPTMVLSMVFAERYGLDQALLAQAIFWSTLLSMLTLPLLAAM